MLDELKFSNVKCQKDRNCNFGLNKKYFLYSLFVYEMCLFSFTAVQYAFTAFKVLYNQMFD